jgi:hypothetical protein
MRRALACLVMALSCSCRVHVLEDGAYALTVSEVLRDDCALSSQAMLGQAALSTAGDSASIAFSTPEARLEGTYKSGVEEMTLDGNATNFSTLVGGQVCLVDLVKLHLDTVTVSPDAFRGTMSVTYSTAQHDACVCNYWFALDAVRVGP